MVTESGTVAAVLLLARVTKTPAAGAGATKVTVVLRDANYPGCIYKLAYDEQADQLFGTYFQAAMGQTYDVVFARLKSAVAQP